MVDKLFKYIRSNKGFSLVEAMVTVVIISIAMIPISMVFTQTITTTIGTRKQLEANELAQRYIETLKNKEYEAFLAVFEGNDEKIINPDTAVSGIDIEPIPKGYRAIISYDAATFESSTVVPSEPDAVDMIITIDSGYDKTVGVGKGDGTDIEEHIGTALKDRVIYIKADRSEDKFRVYYLVDGEPDVEIYPTGITIDESAIRIKLGNKGATDSYPQYNTTTIKVDSNLSSEVSVYIYEGANNTVKATTEVVSGIVSFNRNLTNVSGEKRRIVEIQVAIMDLTTNEIIASLTTTKIDE